jgi:hypothetical protein
MASSGIGSSPLIMPCKKQFIRNFQQNHSTILHPQSQQKNMFFHINKEKTIPLSPNLCPVDRGVITPF